MSVQASADWCAQAGGVAICGTSMKEHSRESQGDKWCFVCRKRHEFWWVVTVPDGLSYYGPEAGMEGVAKWCSDLFPGWVRGPIDE
ncbi:hypothetical protein EV139_0899 [Leucobacter luti]|uniref:Uncharacterized protein n=1 Tax=Leucobacter luti TaxID=340320 RepID=A0A4Q7U3L0_9MICO|nr:hypothetical protein EV139_0899 [Leucobacter luti]